MSEYISNEYQKQLDELANILRRPLGDVALQDTIEFDPEAGFEQLELA